MKKIMIFSLILTSFSCKDGAGIFYEKFYIMYVLNNSSREVCYYLDRAKAEFQYPDTTLPTVKPSVRRVKTGEKYGHSSQTKWEDFINDMPSDTMSMYIFDANVFDSTDWNIIRNNYMVLKRYNISAEYLRNNNNTIVYP